MWLALPHRRKSYNMKVTDVTVTEQQPAVSHPSELESDGGIPTSGIPISSLNPDVDGDGKVEKWEQEVFERIKAADADQSGSIDVKELFSVIKGAADADKAKRLFQKLLAVAVVVIIMLIGSMLAVSIAAGEMVKESHVKGDGLMTNKKGGAIKVDVATTDHSLFSLGALPIEGVATIERINLYMDTTGNAAFGNGIIESTFEVSSAMKFTEDSVAFYTPSGAMIKLDATAKKGTITMDGATFPVDDEDRSDEKTPSRRRLRRGRKPSLRTRGRFSMSFRGGAAGGAGRRELQ